jgi:ribose 1,5-bisphosphokinase
MMGRLVLVVGPSGSGKDTLLAGAAAALQSDARFIFVRRVVTRPASHEDHDTASEAEFQVRHSRGEFALSWQAHGLSYGIPQAAVLAIERGAVVVANVSRSVVAEALARYPAEVVEITAPPALRAARLASRGRETEADILARLAREVAIPGASVHRVVNDSTVEDGVTTLVALLGSFLPSRAATAAEI